MNTTTIFEKYKFVIMDFTGEQFTIDDLLNHGVTIGIYHARTTFKNAMYRFEDSGYVKRVVRGKGREKSVWQVLPALLEAINFKDYDDAKCEAQRKKEIEEKQVIYKHKYDQLTRNYELIEPIKGRLITETMAHSHDRQKSPRVWVGNMWDAMI